MGRGKHSPVEKYIQLGIKYGLAELKVCGDTVEMKFGPRAEVPTDGDLLKAKRDLEITTYFNEQERLDELQITDPIKYEELIIKNKLGE